MGLGVVLGVGHGSGVFQSEPTAASSPISISTGAQLLMSSRSTRGIRVSDARKAPEDNTKCCAAPTRAIPSGRWGPPVLAVMLEPPRRGEEVQAAPGRHE